MSHDIYLEGWPFEAHVIDPERGGTVAVLVDEQGRILVRDCFGVLEIDTETALALADHVQHAVARVEDARKRRREALR